MSRTLWRLAGPVGMNIAVSAVLGLLVTAGYVAQGLFLAFALVTLLGGGPTRRTLAWLLAFGCAVALRALLIWASELAAQQTAQRTKKHLRGRLLAKLLQLGPGGAAAWATGDLQTTIIGGVEALEAYYSRYLPAVLVAMLGCAGVIGCLAWVDTLSGLLLAAFVVALPAVDRLWLRWRMPKSSGIFAAMGAFAAYLLDSLRGVTTLKAFDAAGRRRSLLAERARALRAASMQTLQVTLMRTGVTGLVALGGVALVLAVNAWRVASGHLTAVGLFITLFLAREAFRPLDRLEKAFHTAWAASGAAMPMIALLEAEPAVIEPSAPRPFPRRTDVVFDTVSFSYPGRDTPALSSLSFEVREREFIALVGPSGAGKTTVVGLLLRWFDPQEGSVRLGGTELKALSLRELRAHVSVVSQDIVLFHGTIEDNLRLARPDATHEQIRVAARAAHLDQFIDSLPQGYATSVGERGAQLSGGQRQRLALARALLKDAPILVLDEATSSIDPATDRAIQDALAHLTGQRTTIVIAHRLSTIRHADRIIVLERGRLMEEGSHDALLAREGAYAALLRAQDGIAEPLSHRHHARSVSSAPDRNGIPAAYPA